MKTIADFKKKFNVDPKTKKVKPLEFKEITDENGVKSKWITAMADGAKIICKPDQNVTEKSSIKEIKPGTWMVTKVYTSTVVFTV